MRSNRAAIGARIRVGLHTKSGRRDIYATVTAGASFGGSSLQQEIGLGQATAIESVAVTWPASGETQLFADLAMDRAYKIREGDLVPTPRRTAKPLTYRPLAPMSHEPGALTILKRRTDILMRITRVETLVVRLPVDPAGKGGIGEWAIVLIHTDQGLQGLGRGGDPRVIAAIWHPCS